MADVASRRHSLDRTIFLTTFSAMFPPPQGKFWTMFLLSNKITSKVSSELLKKQSTLESWRRLPTKEYVFGKLGPTSSPSTFQTMTENCVHCHNQKKSMCWSVSPNICDLEAFLDANNRFMRKQSKYCCGPSQHASNWTENRVRRLTRKENTIRKSANLLRATAATTHPPKFQLAAPLTVPAFMHTYSKSGTTKQKEHIFHNIGFQGITSPILDNADS
jgi:hypothetical protein